MAFGNQLKTVALLGLLTGLLLWIGSFWGRSGLFFALVFSVIMNFGSYWFSDKIALAIYRAKEVKENEAPRLHKIVREVSHLAKIPMPKVYILPAPYANAFATGRNRKHAAVAATQGILDLLSDDELKGVIAHEVSHIKHNDILIQSVAATIAGVISYIAMIARWSAIFGGFGGRDRDSGSMIELLVLAILTPLLATIIRLAISRSREYLADESGARLLHNGYSLADALEKLEDSTKHVSLRPTSQSQATAHMFISSPFRGKTFLSLFMTHPSTGSRVKRLRSMNF
ncbi:zinc metalloprotease HtpX [Candidatus Woesearchaeota archaeon]|nr:zinc metalloprotease HtpX [Candidatus Woesearchaeota archaeon]